MYIKATPGNTKYPRAFSGGSMSVRATGGGDENASKPAWTRDHANADSRFMRQYAHNPNGNRSRENSRGTGTRGCHVVHNEIIAT